MCHKCGAAELYPGRRVCPDCRRAEKRAQYHADAPKSRAMRASYYKKNRDKVLWAQREKAYGITKGQYDQMVRDQGGVCAICGTDDPGKKGSWGIDHDHDCCAGKTSCGKCVRGLLCSRCNAGIAMFQDDPARLQHAIDYLERTSVRRRPV